jgi:hypothetical protein
MRLLYFQHTWDGAVNSQIQNYDDKEKAHVAFHGSMRASINDANIRKIVCELMDEDGRILKYDSYEKDTAPTPEPTEETTEE